MDFVRRYFWAICLLFGIIGFGFTWFALPHQSPIDKIWWLAFKLVIYGFIVLSIAFFPNKTKHGFLLVIIPFFVFLGYLIPRMSYFGIYGTINDQKLMGECYTTLYLLLYPLINFAVTFAYRMGGGTPGNSAKISVCGMIIIFSGFLDLMWHPANSMAIPATHDYAYHVIVFFGRAPSHNELIGFALCHIPLFIAVLFLPLDKWFQKMKLLP